MQLSFASTFTLGDALFTVLEFAVLFFWIWILISVVVDIFRSEIDLVMAQIGCPSLDQLGPDFLWREDRARNV